MTSKLCTAQLCSLQGKKSYFMIFLLLLLLCVCVMCMRAQVSEVREQLWGSHLPSVRPAVGTHVMRRAHQSLLTAETM